MSVKLAEARPAATPDFRISMTVPLLPTVATSAVTTSWASRQATALVEPARLVNATLVTYPTSL